MDYIALATKDLGINENMQKYAGNVTLSGVIIVFAMLIALVLIISAFGIIMYRLTNKDKTQKSENKKAEKASKAVIPSVPVSASVDSEDDIIAAISAAVMMMYDGSGITPVIRSVRPAVKSVRSAWAAAGIANNTRSF